MNDAELRMLRRLSTKPSPSAQNIATILAAVPNLVEEVEQLTAKLDAANEIIAKSQVAAMAYTKAVDALGLAAPDTPEVLATAEPIGAAHADLYLALGMIKPQPCAEYPNCNCAAKRKEQG